MHIVTLTNLLLRGTLLVSGVGVYGWIHLVILLESQISRLESNDIDRARNIVYVVFFVVLVAKVPSNFVNRS